MSSQAAARPSLVAFSLKARRFFFKMNLREKALLLLFVIALAAVWFSSQTSRIGAVWDEIEIAKVDAQEQELWIASEPRIDADYGRYIAQINLAELPARDEVNSQIDALVRSFDLGRFTLAAPRTQEGKAMNFHTFSLTLQQANYARVMQFTQELKSKLPYVSLQRITIRARPNDDKSLDVGFVLKSLEYTQ